MRGKVDQLDTFDGPKPIVQWLWKAKITFVGIFHVDHLDLSSQALRNPSPLGSVEKPQQPARRCRGKNLLAIAASVPKKILCSP